MTVTVSKELLHHVAAIAGRAASAILEVYETDFDVSDKADGSPVTQADLAANELICAALKALAPTIPIVSEEGEHALPAGTDADVFWLVDPLDGTRGFANRTDDFTVNIALVRTGRPVLGVVHWPVRGACYCGAQGTIATRRDPDGSTSIINTVEAVGRPLAVVTSRTRSNPHVRAFLDGLDGAQVQQRGSALKSCLVAEGAADVYPGFSETCYWDTAAPQAVLEAAGGALTDLKLQPLRYQLELGVKNPRFIAFGTSPDRWRHAIPPSAID